MNETDINGGIEENRDALLRQFTMRVGVELSDLGLLDNALTHASYLPVQETGVRDYESLEFLGDAVLGLAIATYLFERYPEKTPGEYTKLRATVVNRKAVARVAQVLEIAPLIRLGKGEESIGGRKRNALLADSMEAVIGAIYLTAGWQVAQEFVVKAFDDELEQACAATPTWDYKSMLQTYCQAQRQGLPQFDVTRSSGPDHHKHFEIQVRIGEEICGHGEGYSKKEAEQNSAFQALKQAGVIE